MKPIPLTRTEAGLEQMSQWYGRFHERLPFETITKRIETSFGHSDVLISSPTDCPGEDTPIVLLHGAMAGAPHALGEMHTLPDRCRIHAINIPGQSIRAAAVRLQFNSLEYSDWLGQVLDGLAIERATIIGVSWGGSVALQFAKHCPERVAGMILLVPGSIVRGPWLKGFKNVGLPMLRFKLFPSIRNRNKAFSALLTVPDEFWYSYLSDAMAHWNIDFGVPPLVTNRDMQGLAAPVYVIAAEHDESFPGSALIDRAHSLFPNLVGTHLIPGAKHCPSTLPEDRKRLAQELNRALDLCRGQKLRAQ